MNILVCGGAGFIGSHFVDLCVEKGHHVVVLDKLTYAGKREYVNEKAQFYLGDIRDFSKVKFILFQNKINALFNFAAESHVDRSIEDAESFVSSNIIGTYTLLKASQWYFENNKDFKYIQISTDEVYGDLGPSDEPFKEDDSFKPHSPYSASKASADHLVSAWHHTYGLPVVTTHSSNNYGPRQYPEKLIPYAISCFLRGVSFGIHGNGQNVRDWIWVGDNCKGIYRAWEVGGAGERYLIGGACEKTNLEIIQEIVSQISMPCKHHFVEDRRGNDRRYALNTEYTKRELNWEPEMAFELGLKQTIDWYKRGGV